FTAGASSFTINNDANSNPDSVVLGAITTRNIGATVNFSQPVNGAVSATNGYTTSTANTANGILGGSATVGNEWATNNGTNIVALSTYQTGTTPSTWATTNDVKISAALAANAGTQTVNSLNFQTATASGRTPTQ